MAARPALAVAISTWNVGVAPPSDMLYSIDAWLHLNDTPAVDIHVVCMQEVVDINTPLAHVPPNPFNQR